MATALSDEFVLEYFSQLNSLAGRIQADITEAIENYEHLWAGLDKAEQITIINEAVIKPEVKINYHRTTSSTATKRLLALPATRARPSKLSSGP